jgi:hypothetical protein
MPDTNQNASDQAAAISAARRTARHAAITLARETGATVTTRPLFPGTSTTTQDVEPLAGMRAARAIELGARHTARGYIRAAREAGHDWHQIGAALGLTPDGDPQQAGQTVAEAACTYAAGNPDTETARRYGRSFAWHCDTCDHLITDRGLCNGPADDEHGHATACTRLAATIASAEAAWAKAEANWEAGT